jgi:uroporphyrinogen decarboxylase
MGDLFSVEVTPDWRGLVDCIMRRGTPERVHHIELFLDAEVQDAVCHRFGLLEGIDPGDPFFLERKTLAVQSFLGYDYVRCGVEGVDMSLRFDTTADTADLVRAPGRRFVDEHRGPITSWDEFEAYPWPDPDAITTRGLEWYQENLPEGMCIVAGGGFAHFAEHLMWLMGYETFCLALFDQRDLVTAIAEKLTRMFETSLKRILEFDRVRIVWGSDDMGFKTGLLCSPADMREFVLPGHRLMAEMSHEAGLPYILHSCGKLDDIMDDLVSDIKIDAKHSFEDTIENVTDLKQNGYGREIALLGGIDVDFLCRATETEVRKRVRTTLDACMDGGGYCLGTGNSVANYVPLDNYLAMVDEGRRWTP